jgi:hypothetical protein
MHSTVRSHNNQDASASEGRWEDSRRHASVDASATMLLESLSVRAPYSIEVMKVTGREQCNGKPLLWGKV